MRILSWARAEWKHGRRNRELFMLALPAVTFKLIFNYLPLVGLIIAFKKYNFAKGLWGSDWVGWDNFRFFFQSDTAFRITRNTILYNGAFIVLGTVIAIAFAIMMNEIGRRWLKIHQTVMFLPYFLSWVVVSYVTMGFLDHKSGFLNQLLTFFGQDPVRWYETSAYWPVIIILVYLWKSVGFSTLIYYAGILGIDSSYYEAARIDGAGKMQMIRHITIPLLTPLVVILFIVAVGNIFRADFGLFYFIPNDVGFLYGATDVIDTYVYRSLRVVGDIGMSTAVGLYQSVVGFALVLTTNYIIKKINSDNALW
ncbi:sugar ABC transporter permease [Paenibacillus sp. MY03]|jgi:putative aldouronate transport system permease protein|uniref:ABC transporter permease n=1 Tax=unclassified Paenibacillus TaxID=185978 RepID=UPI000B3C2DE8|nr:MULTISPECIES: ABC transporter permease subunit [unclassified Paenibacillus]OUS73058.1 sugar ABC transporter permease [Paenibacillus sp. MY03]QNK56948.1 sugar ABC transporter permease [Paenibacillus sp. PAMC21692]